MVVAEHRRAFLGGESGHGVLPRLSISTRTPPAAEVEKLSDSLLPWNRSGWVTSSPPASGALGGDKTIQAKGIPPQAAVSGRSSSPRWRKTRARSARLPAPTWLQPLASRYIDRRKPRVPLRSMPGGKNASFQRLKVKTVAAGHDQPLGQGGAVTLMHGHGASSVVHVLVCAFPFPGWVRLRQGNVSGPPCAILRIRQDSHRVGPSAFHITHGKSDQYLRRAVVGFDAVLVKLLRGANPRSGDRPGFPRAGNPLNWRSEWPVRLRPGQYLRQGPVHRAVDRVLCKSASQMHRPNDRRLWGPRQSAANGCRPVT